ncbi:MAG TPA: YkgJ family cysteine cluster protein [Planctomycetes bacterium]|nr:YkgJ family cysteine cluster protein [Planctomycetota bacterium]
MKNNSRLLKRVAEIYEWLDQQVRNNDDMSGHCDACGKCCDFESFDHHLFVTPPELMYLAANLGDEKLKAMPTSRCPYQLDGKCTVYEYRFAGCRIFCCNGDSDFQSRLSESVLKKLKSTCTEFQIAYHYTDLATALGNRDLWLMRKPHR